MSGSTISTQHIVAILCIGAFFLHRPGGTVEARWSERSDLGADIPSAEGLLMSRNGDLEDYDSWNRKGEPVFNMNPIIQKEIEEIEKLLGVTDLDDEGDDRVTVEIPPPPPGLKKRYDVRIHPQPSMARRSDFDMHPNVGMQKQRGESVPIRPMNRWQPAVIASICSVGAVVGVVIATTCWYKIHQSTKEAAASDSGSVKDRDYRGGGNRSPSEVGPKGSLPGSIPGDRKLAQSAQMYHYQHQKQQMIALERASGNMKPDASDEESEPENEEEDYTVYECPGLATAGEMEVRNPLFQDDTSGQQGPPTSSGELRP